MIKPTRMCDTSAKIPVENLKIGDDIFATIEKFVYPSEIVLDYAGKKCIMDICDYDYNADDKNMRSIYHNTGKPIRARIKKFTDEMVVLERLSVIDETIEHLKNNLGNVIEATIESFANFGIFVDLGNGVISLIQSAEISKCRCFDMDRLFNLGDIVKVKLLSYDHINRQFEISRKQAYEILDETMLPKESSVVVTCNYELYDKSGVFVEIDPANTGIMDYPEFVKKSEFTFGRKMCAIVTKHVDGKGFRVNFCNFL